MPELDIERKYKVPPYKAAEYTKRAQKLISQAMKDSSTFLKPYTEAKIILEIALAMANKTIELFEEG